MRGSSRNREGEFCEVWLTAFSAVFALERVWRDHKAAQNALNRMFLCERTLGPRNVGSQSQTHAYACMENQRGCFFNHLFKGFLVGFFSSKNKCALNKDTLVTHIGNVNQNIKSSWDFIHGQWKYWNVKKNSRASDHICLPILILWGCIAPVYSRWCNYPIIWFPPNTHTRTSSASSYHISVSIFCMCYFILPCISTPLGPIWCPFLLWTPPYHNPAHGLHIPLPVAAAF